MRVKLFGDTVPINWTNLGVCMPFAPMHELAEKYELEPQIIHNFLPIATYEDIYRTFEIKECSMWQYLEIYARVQWRLFNTISALDQATSDTICVNLGAGYHHAGKYPNTGYAYSLINDIIWAVDYQLEQGKTIGIIDLDFHFGGGTCSYYVDEERVKLYDQHHPKGELHQHNSGAVCGNRQTSLTRFPVWNRIDKILLNIGTDWYKNDALFGQYGQMEAKDLLNVWKETVQQITIQKVPLAITMGGGYGPAGLKLYEKFIAWLQEL